MADDPLQPLLPDEEHRLALRELAEFAGLTEVEVLELVDCGALTAFEDAPGHRVFSWRSITVARTARKLREDFDLEPHGVALLLQYLDRIRTLEEELRRLRAQLPR